MERTALRLATVAALLNGGWPPPTLAGEYVYDSLQDDIKDIAPGKRKPIIVVKTDEDSTGYQTGRFGGRVCRLLIEMSVLTNVPGEDGKLVVGWPRTDASLEALLDALEWQTYLALKGHAPWAEWYRNTMGYSTWERMVSAPRYTSPDRGAVRLAIRTLELMVKLPAECVPPLVKEGDPNEAVPFLPDSIRKLFQTIEYYGNGPFKTKYIKDIQDVVEAFAPIPRPAAPLLHRVWMTLPKYEVEADVPIEQVVSANPVPLLAQAPSLSHPDLTQGA